MGPVEVIIGVVEATMREADTEEVGEAEENLDVFTQFP